ncbi:MAG TPA: hypothetical protein VK154_14670 [Chitinophagales bacterium]|nr:hypothetical protein [Chitinophagales bacterium]
MKTPMYLALFVGLLLIASCSKKEEDKKLTYFDPSTTKLKSVTYGGNNQTHNYTYNASGLLESILVSDGSKTTYSYDSVSVTETSYTTGGNIATINYIELNDSGLAVNATVTDGGGTVTAHKFYTYDAGKHITTEENYTPANALTQRLEYAWYGSSNLLNFTIFDSTGTNGVFTFYQTFFDGPTSISNTCTGRAFMGISTYALIRKSVRYSALYGDNVETYDYVLDGLQRVSQKKTFDRNGVLKYTDTYTYY